MKRKVKVAIITDPIGSFLESVEEERDKIFQTIQCEIEKKLELVVAGEGMHVIKDRDIDLLIIDYGGMSTMGSSDTPAWQICEACEWADSHPGRLLVLYTMFTRLLYERELKAEFVDLDNIKAWYADDRDLNSIKAWFSSDEFEPYDWFEGKQELITPGRGARKWMKQTD